ncbi:MAG: 16S rRNA (guanine(527)-N(7))-methyltransferase RsmG [Oceanicaulis sp.]|uniref:16S rRNA (guanine(527)-N(7))-methyltransferase RsmG n=1 Tax=Glycocaulis sp. TaxID=1969725 RepID=UPI0025C2731C|nr:16S rRNA (guanine(527)-N(7))-methyltransferase RsmG [Glycocaulis sp.]MCC5981997.1 16S rRNA (guanine(527)-N(7))-methyltransferase RsmG [Oceanicaulis sp.]MCH8521984.1 16S rRNA (guanine(527)-N(7))-methyltransferase RsmG [Glycocaulis sp.]
MHERAFDAAAFQAATGVSRETLDRFETWRRLLIEWSKHTNLVSRSTLDDFWFRHAYDSWQLLRLAPEGARYWVDIGAGAGFPGLALAITLAETAPGEVRVTLIESIGKKAAFLRAVIEETGIRADVITARAEEVSALPSCDVVTARAVAPLAKLLTWMQPYVEKGAIALIPKGARHEEELTDARKSWTFEASLHASLTSDEAAIIRIERLTRAR